MFQSLEEVTRVGNDWCHNFAPADLIQNQVNLNAIVAYVDSYLGGAITVSNLERAERALRAAGKLQLVPPKTPEQIRAEAEQAQVAAINEQSKRWQKQHRETLNQTKERNFAGEVRAKNEEAARIKEAADAEKTIINVISNYSAGHARLAGRIDYAETERRQKDLRKLEVRVNGKRDAVKTLALVREAISKLPG
jgi:hypothetical protein